VEWNPRLVHTDRVELPVPKRSIRLGLTQQIGALLYG